MRSQTGSRSHGVRRSHAVLETRSFVCAHIKRNDPTSRRLVQYLSMQTSCLVLLVRDGKTGSILVKPPEEETWLVREKTGLGRAARNEWNIIQKVGTEFFEDMDRHREWHFGFKEVRQWGNLLCVMEKLTCRSITTLSSGTWSPVCTFRSCTTTFKG
jgi:hypothetical protein